MKYLILAEKNILDRIAALKKGVLYDTDDYSPLLQFPFCKSLQQQQPLK